MPGQELTLRINDKISVILVSETDAHDSYLKVRYMGQSLPVAECNFVTPSPERDYLLVKDPSRAYIFLETCHGDNRLKPCTFKDREFFFELQNPYIVHFDEKPHPVNRISFTMFALFDRFKERKLPNYDSQVTTVSVQTEADAKSGSGGLPGSQDLGGFSQDPPDSPVLSGPSQMKINVKMESQESQGSSSGSSSGGFWQQVANWKLPSFSGQSQDSSKKYESQGASSSGQSQSYSEMVADQQQKALATGGAPSVLSREGPDSQESNSGSQSQSFSQTASMSQTIFRRSSPESGSQRSGKRVRFEDQVGSSDGRQARVKSEGGYGGSMDSGYGGSMESSYGGSSGSMGSQPLVVARSMSVVNENVKVGREIMLKLFDNCDQWDIEKKGLKVSMSSPIKPGPVVSFEVMMNENPEDDWLRVAINKECIRENIDKFDQKGNFWKILVDKKNILFHSVDGDEGTFSTAWEAQVFQQYSKCPVEFAMKLVEALVPAMPRADY
jgi:hypothetical protein